MALTDKLFSPLVTRLLTCLCNQAVLLAHWQPGLSRCCIMPGGEVNMDFALTEDVCCNGMAWVRVPTITSGWDEVEAGTTRCTPDQWTLTLEMGFAGCMPVGTASVLPTCAEYLATWDQQMAEAAAMRRAVACCFPDDSGRLVRVGEYAPDNDGNCRWATLTIDVKVIACDECAEGYVDP